MYCSNVSSTKLWLWGFLLLPCVVGTQIRIFVWEEPPKKPVLAISMWDEWHLPACVFKVSNKTPSFRDHVLQCVFLWGGKELGFALSLKPLQQKATVKKGSSKSWCHGEGSGRPCGQAEDRTEQPRVCGLLVSHLRPRWGSEPSRTPSYLWARVHLTIWGQWSEATLYRSSRSHGS